MKSKSKYYIDNTIISEIFLHAGIGSVDSLYIMEEGEFNSVYCVKLAGKEYVLKIAPYDKKCILTYEKDMLNSELNWYYKIKENTDIKIPKIYFSDFSNNIIDAPYFIMEKLNGVSMNKIGKDGVNPALKLAAMAAEIHKIRGIKYGYEQNGLYDNWYSAIRSMVNNLISDAKAKGHRSRRGEELLKYIDKYKDVLSDVGCRMVNFDLWAANVICNKDDNGAWTYAWIDPERSFWGDRVADLVAIDCGKSIEDKHEVLQAYNLSADEPIELNEQVKIRYYIAQAYAALIMEVEKYYRYNIFSFGWYRNVASSKFFFDKSFEFLKNAK